MSDLKHVVKTEASSADVQVAKQDTDHGIPDLRREMEDALQRSISELPGFASMSPDQLQIYASQAACKDAVAPFYAPSSRLSLSFRHHLFVLTPSATNPDASSLHLIDLKPIAISNKSAAPKVCVCVGFLLCSVPFVVHVHV